MEWRVKEGLLYFLMAQLTFTNFDDVKDKVYLIKPTTSPSLSHISKTPNDLRCLLILTFHYQLKMIYRVLPSMLKADNNCLNRIS